MMLNFRSVQILKMQCQSSLVRVCLNICNQTAFLYLLVLRSLFEHNRSTNFRCLSRIQDTIHFLYCQHRKVRLICNQTAFLYLLVLRSLFEHNRSTNFRCLSRIQDTIHFLYCQHRKVRLEFSLNLLLNFQTLFHILLHHLQILLCSIVNIEKCVLSSR